MAFIIESVDFDDFSSLKKLAEKYPLLNLPADSALLKEKIKTSKNSFSEVLPREKRNFLFVLKEAGRKEVIGSSQIAVQSGSMDIPSYSLKIFKEENFLQLRKITKGPSYLGGLILDKKYRGRAAGKLISLIRFLFVGMFPKVFEDTLHAEVAPPLDEKGRNPFLEDFVKKYISLSMEEIDRLTLVDKEKLFSDYPREKISLSSLPSSVRKSLGKPGPFSERAAKLLKAQNFSFVGEIDPFDGGPYMQAQVMNIPLVQNTKKVFLSSAKKDSLPKKKWLWAKMEKAGLKGGLLEGKQRDNQIEVSEETFSLFPSFREVYISPFE